MEKLNQPFCIELNSQEELDAIMSFYKEKGYKEFGNSHTYKKGYVVDIKPKDKEWQTATNNWLNLPIKTLSELGIVVKPKSLVGRYVKVKDKESSYYGDYYLLTSKNSEDIYYGTHIKTKIKECFLPTDFWELMPEGFIPEEEKKYQYEVVHCTTQEEWDFVLDTIPKHYQLSKEKHRFEEYCKNYPEGIAVCWEDKSYCGLEYFTKYNTKIYSFSEWYKKFNHKPDFMKETNCEFKVGDWVIVKSTKQGGSGNGINTDNLVTKLLEKGSVPSTGCFLEESDFTVKESGKKHFISLKKNILFVKLLFKKSKLLLIH